MRTSFPLVLCFSLWLVPLLSRGISAVLYDVTPIVIPGRSVLFTQDINNSGTAFVTARTNAGVFESYSYSKTTGLVALFPGGTSGSVLAVNDLGQYVGNGYSTTGFFYDPITGFRSIPNFGGTNVFTNPAAINNVGQVVASAVIPGNSFLSSYIWDSKINSITPVDPTRTYYSFGKDISENGVVVGEAWTGTNSPAVKQAFRFAPGGGMQILPRLGGQQAQAFGVNESGNVVGWSEFSSSQNTHAVMWNAAGSLTDLGTLGGSLATAYAINNTGQVVGSSNYDATSLSHGFVYRDGQMNDLNNLIDPALGLEIVLADDINDFGQILVQTRGFGLALLTPVPEPTTGAILFSGIVVAFFLRRKQ